MNLQLRTEDAAQITDSHPTPIYQKVILYADDREIRGGGRGMLGPLRSSGVGQVPEDGEGPERHQGRQSWGKQQQV